MLRYLNRLPFDIGSINFMYQHQKLHILFLPYKLCKNLLPFTISFSTTNNFHTFSNLVLVVLNIKVLIPKGYKICRIILFSLFQGLMEGWSLDYRNKTLYSLHIDAVNITFRG